MNNSRLLLVIFFVLLLFAGLLVKLFELQVIKGEELKYYAQKQQTKLEIISAERGLIYDRNNVLLVYNRNDVDIYLDLRMTPTERKEELASKFSSVFGKPASHYNQLMKQNGKTISIEKKVPIEKAKLLNEIKMTALFSVDKPIRVYQYGSLASHILGYVNTESVGVNGVAKYYEDHLNGQQGSQLVERDAIGRIITIADEETRAAVPGNNLVLTIDKNYQNILEEELRTGINDYEAASATGIILDPNTGEILALANIGDYDPNRYWKFDDERRKNKSITDVYEPGSTFKILTLAALIDAGKCTEDELVFVENGKYKFRSTYIRDTHKNAYLTVKGIVEESSNIGISKLVQRINNDTFYKSMRGFGLGNYTSITLPGEVKGILKNPNTWSKYTKTFMSFAYEVAVTPLQLILAYSAIINGGLLYEPHIIKERTGKDGIVKYESSPVIVRRVISEETSSRLRSILTSAVQNGTGSAAQVEGILVGGKTGTSQKIIDGKYSRKKHNASFIGFFPAENPQVICLVLFHSPRKEHYGGKVAAPVFKKITQRILTLDSQRFQVPELYDESNESDIKIMSSNYLEENGSQILNISNNFVNYNNNLPNSIMPDLRGYSVKEALVSLNSLGLKYDITGSGLVTYQSIKPGITISKSDLCKINCSESSINGANIY
jgi:cell division protein FtsI (penicillin-binding protein 3)